MKASLGLGRVFGIPIEVNASWAVVFFLLTVLLAQQFDEAHFHWPAAQRWLVAVAMVLLFFGSVLVHELSHSVVATRRGIPVLGITLFIFGGVSRLAKDPERPLTEFAVAVVGPAISIMLSGIFGGLWYLLRDGPVTLEVMLFLLAWSNLMLGVFNILPGFPLDGGRVLRAAIWGFTGSYRKGTYVSTRAGQAIGAAMVLLGLALGIFLEPLDGIWLALVGAFLFSVATSNLRQDRSRSDRHGSGEIEGESDV